MKVGFIGLGKMGAGICSNIVKNGIDVVVYDINPANVQKFVDMGASSAATVKELAAQVEVCITCVPMPKDAKGVLLGPDGVFENLPEGGVGAVSVAKTDNAYKNALGETCRRVDVKRQGKTPTRAAVCLTKEGVWRYVAPGL